MKKLIAAIAFIVASGVAGATVEMNRSNAAPAIAARVETAKIIPVNVMDAGRCYEITGGLYRCD